ncbi:PEP-CTERM sorting domain-containing protein [Rhodoferax sp. GW822-FHT02A01]|uniref:PEP-CTERM sorting domain-containing protein n=1 Tax=Rhodoferax sp. GW822-FHT02A01 TaxID=3141537 RepID=UPI00315D5861
MKNVLGKYSLALSAVSLAVLALPAQAVEVSFSGSNTATTGVVSGVDNLGNTWVTSDGPSNINSSFTMADQQETAQAFNILNFSNGLGSWANSFQLTINKSQQGSGFKGIIQTPVASGLSNGFMVQEIAGDSTSWASWAATYSLLDTISGLYQQVLFTAPEGKQLSQGQNFMLDVNFSGIITTDSGWAASWDDRAAPTNDVPEPGTVTLMGLGAVGLLGAARRKKA